MIKLCYILLCAFLGALQGVNLHDNILILGDSLACGSQMRVKEFLKQNESVVYDCKVGSTLQQWNSEKAKIAFERNKDISSVIVFLGTNNYTATKMPEISNILGEIEKHNVKCTWIGPTAVRGKQWQINQLIKEAVSKNCDFVDITDSEILLQDGIHPTFSSWFTILKRTWEIREK